VETQALGIVVDNNLQAVTRFQVLEQLSDDAVAEARFDIRNLDHSFGNFGHAVTDRFARRLSQSISVGL
jgi:hypothetical protein